MKFRPCIDIHNGNVKQIVGGSLKDEGDSAENNFISDKDAAYYAEMYMKDGFSGGHIILLNPPSSEYYEQDLEQAGKALALYPGGMQIGGGVNTDNALRFIEMGASHVIVTSFVFRDGMIDYDRLKKLSDMVGREHLVLDLSCRYYEAAYYIVTDRWQKMTSEKLNIELLDSLSEYCDEFLVHAVDVEGKASGVERDVIRILGEYCRKESGDTRSVTYAGGIHSLDDLEFIRDNGMSGVDFTIGSALDIFGGNIPYEFLKKFSD